MKPAHHETQIHTFLNLSSTQIDRFTFCSQEQRKLPTGFLAIEPFIQQKTQKGILQFFFQIDNQRAFIYCSDEMGDFYYFHVPYLNHHLFLNKLQRFTHHWLSQRDADLKPGTSIQELQFWEIITINNDQSQITPIATKNFHSDFSNEFDIHVQVTLDHTKNTNIKITCENKEYDENHLGKVVFIKVAQAILNHREMSLPYPAYIINLDLSPLQHTVFKGVFPSFIDHIQYKLLIEQQLNSALQKEAMQIPNDIELPE
ncbi:hypothetical protein KCM76_17425 [Zooshikella marina]|uniref:hypothetical protein n=1 Tax=Zooshikella ganghwensis TaxID=202772 RepID=UPI001BB03E54|nr:hypothetical protein [Zooshikella ganghwensis]MBU2707778.1 hypothetical protein [Zooshikella ganghwensis]